YLLDYQRTGQLYRLMANPAAAAAGSPFPRLLSQTGLFASTRDHVPAAGGIAYEINASLWADDGWAAGRRAVPGTARIAIGERGQWLLPDGAVLARTVSLELERGQRASRKRVETQVLHREAGSWRPYSFVWNDDQTDAVLADAAGSSRTL